MNYKITFFIAGESKQVIVPEKIGKQAIVLMNSETTKSIDLYGDVYRVNAIMAIERTTELTPEEQERMQELKELRRQENRLIVALSYVEDDVNRRLIGGPTDKEKKDMKKLRKAVLEVRDKISKFKTKFLPSSRRYNGMQKYNPFNI